MRGLGRLGSPIESPGGARLGEPGASRRRLARSAHRKDVDAIVLRLVLEHVAGGCEEMGDVDHRKRIGAANTKSPAWSHPRERLARLERRQRTPKASKVEQEPLGIGRGRVGHGVAAAFLIDRRAPPVLAPLIGAGVGRCQ